MNDASEVPSSELGKVAMLKLLKEEI